MTQDIQTDLRKLATPKVKKAREWFFKTGPGEYGEGDRFIGVTVPKIRAVAKRHRDLPAKDLWQLLSSPIHEDRLAALFILTHRFEHSDDKGRKGIYDRYLRNTRYVNNWDLVDASAHLIVGAWLLDRSKAPLTKLARSQSLWERRIAIIATYWFIRNGRFEETLRIAKLLLKDDHDLIHKAVGWMLREVGNRDVKVEEAFLKTHYSRLPRTMLRYAIEKLPEARRQRYLKGTM